MFILNSGTIQNFRISITKIIFIFSYSHKFHFIQKLSPFEDKEKYLEAIEYGSMKNCRIYFFNKPKKSEINGDYCIIVYCLRINKNFNENIEYRVLSTEFIETLNNEFQNGFLHIANSEYFKKFNVHDFKSRIFYKYYGTTQSLERFIKTIDGDISFVNPALFNDPFDCDYSDVITGNNKESFKALCLVPSFNNILMWSYYGSNHKGYCLGYDLKDILAQLSKAFDGLCIIGKINYKKKRPPYRKTKTLPLFDEICFVIQCAFTKYTDWNHEEEYRILILDNNPKNNFLSVNVPIQEAYIGKNSDLKVFKCPVIRLKKHNYKYKLLK